MESSPHYWDTPAGIAQRTREDAMWKSLTFFEHLPPERKTTYIMTDIIGMAKMVEAYLKGETD